MASYNPTHVYKLKKAICGLKQAPRAWYDMLLSFLLSQKFSKGAVDPTLFTRKEGKDILMGEAKEASKRRKSMLDYRIQQLSKGSNEGSGIIPEVPDEPKDSFGSSSSSLS
ncbi:retrovirus-related pol polyprotein from transposon TNT 1-94 [Tanacetum coccineum]